MAQHAAIGVAAATFIAATPGRKHAPEVLDAARMCLVDWVGVAVGAAGEPAAQAVRRAAARWDTGGRAHVLLGVEWGIAQTNHGKRAGVQRMRPGDGFVYYSPRTSHPDGEPLREFTAIGRVADGEAYQAESDPNLMAGFRPWRRDVRYADALTMADRHAILKNACKEIAYGQGAAITFMSKWRYDLAGSSSHIHNSLWDTGGKKPLGRRNLVGAILAVVGIASVTVGLYASPWDPWILVAIGSVLLILGVTLLAAQLIAPVAQGLRGLLTSWFRVDGKLAANNIRREPRRSANTAAALMIGVMLLALISTFTESLKTTVASEFEQAAADLYMVGAQGNIPQGAIDMVAARDDVESLARMGIAAGRIDGETLMISVIDSVPADGVYPIDVEPALSQMGEGVYVNPALAAQGYSVGDTITIEVGDARDGEVRVHNDTRNVGVAGASLPPIIQELVRHGGLVRYLAARRSL